MPLILWGMTLDAILGILRIINQTTHAVKSLDLMGIYAARSLVYAFYPRSQERGQSRCYGAGARQGSYSCRSCSGSPFLCFVPSSLAVVWSKSVPVGACQEASGESQPPLYPLCPLQEAQIL